jgi:hypothetical protein
VVVVRIERPGGRLRGAALAALSKKRGATVFFAQDEGLKIVFWRDVMLSEMAPY